MGRRLIDEHTGWETAREDLLHTSAALEAANQKNLLRDVDAHLARWDELEKERRAASDAIARANALVSLRDEELDLAVRAVVRELKHAFGDEKNPKFRKFFPEAPSEVLRMALATELERTAKLHTVAQEVKPPKPVQTALKSLETAQEAGRQALARRETATVERARVSLRTDDWKTEANKLRRGVEHKLGEYALANDLPETYPDAFFPRPRPRKKSSEPAPPTPPVA